MTKLFSVSVLSETLGDVGVDQEKDFNTSSTNKVSEKRCQDAQSGQTPVSFCTTRTPWHNDIAFLHMQIPPVNYNYRNQRVAKWLPVLLRVGLFEAFESMHT